MFGFPPPLTPRTKMQIDPTFNPEHNEFADKVISERASLKLLRVLIGDMDWTQKIAVAQIACNRIGAAEPVQIVEIKPVGRQFSYQLQAAVQLMSELQPDILAEIAIQILEDPHDTNE